MPGTEIEARLEAFRLATPGALRVVHGRSNIAYLSGYGGGGATPWLLVGDDRLGMVFYTADEDSIDLLDVASLERFPFGPQDDAPVVLAAAIEAIGDHTALTVDRQWWTEVPPLAGPAGDCSMAVASLRAVKSAWEQDRLREAGRLTVTVMDRLEELAAEGGGPRDLARCYYDTAIAGGGFASTAVPYIALGSATLVNHATWDWDGQAPSAPGSYLLEFSTSVEGYQVPLSRSFTTHATGRRALRAVEDGVDRVREAARPGVLARDLHRLMSDTIETAGFRFSHRAGYSIGLGETETWMEAAVGLLGPVSELRLTPGMAFHIVGSTVRAGDFGVARSNSVLVTEAGCEVLAA